MLDKYPFLKKTSIFLARPSAIGGIYLLVAVLVGLQRYQLGDYNNFKIFQASSRHYLAHLNPYILYPDLHFDLFLYNPTFCVLFLPFAFLPTILGMIAWAVVSAGVYLYAVQNLPLSENSKAGLCYLILPELITSLQNQQTNPLVVGFILLAFIYTERKAVFTATIFPPLGFFIKGYGGISGVFFLLKEPKVRTFLYLLFWGLVIGGLPMLCYTPSQFLTLYGQWMESLRHDYTTSPGISVMGIVKAFFPFLPTFSIQIFGLVAFIFTFFLLLFRKRYELLKLHFLAYLLIWVIIFNQASESATYIIASTGVLIWFWGIAQRNRADFVLFALFMLLTVLSPTDLFPRSILNQYVIPYSLKALPCILIWGKLQYQLLQKLL